MRTGGERTMLQMIDVTDHVGSLLRGKAFDWIFLGKRPKRIASLNANGLVSNVGNGLGIRGVTSAKDRSSEDKEERKRNGDGPARLQPADCEQALRSKVECRSGHPEQP